MKYISILIMISLGSHSFGQGIVGQWQTFDDESKEKKAIIEVYKSGDVYLAKIVELFTGDQNAICEKCTGSKKDQRIVGMVIVEGIRKDGSEFNGGTILDPENGEVYKCYLELIEGNKLKVRGFIGVSLFGRTQYWQRKI